MPGLKAIEWTFCVLPTTGIETLFLESGVQRHAATSLGRSYKMRQKSHIEEEGNFQCLCCHVRTGSIILGIWHLVLHVFSVGILASVIFQPDLVNHMLNQWKDINGITCCNNNEIMNQNLNSQLPELPKLSAGSSENYDFLKELKWELEDVRVALAFTLCKGFVTCLVIYGAVCAYCMSIIWSCYKFVKLLEIQKMVDKCLDLEGEILPHTGYKLQIKPPLYLSSFRQHPQTPHLQTVEGKIP
ncbi:uncharacterized protein LOC143233414 isoform X3 [Tachypleus tridentatus]|uniref:uncharacterized protein LOC143233414 isoform X3 n=1 Tax=Tachypleus tridentatus TaxID=6853 RepID=UPI003FD63C4B